MTSHPITEPHHPTPADPFTMLQEMTAQPKILNSDLRKLFMMQGTTIPKSAGANRTMLAYNARNSSFGPMTPPMPNEITRRSMNKGYSAVDKSKLS